MELTCPSCRSDNTQRLSIVHESGLSSIQAETHASGVGIGRGGLSVGVGSASTSGKTQTMVSQRAAPPQKKPYVKPLLTMLGTFIVLSLVNGGMGSQALGVVISLSWVGATVGWIYHAFQYNAKIWPPLKEQWQSSFLCLRCSHVFLPTRD